MIKQVIKKFLINVTLTVIIGALIGIVGMYALTGASSSGSSSNSAFDINEIENGDYIVKTDESVALPALTKEQLKKACNCLSGEEKKNALNFIDAVKDAEDKYKVNAVFSLAIFRKENHIASDKSGILGHDTYNIGSLLFFFLPQLP